MAHSIVSDEKGQDDAKDDFQGAARKKKVDGWSGGEGGGGVGEGPLERLAKLSCAPEA